MPNPNYNAPPPIQEPYPGAPNLGWLFYRENFRNVWSPRFFEEDCLAIDKALRKKELQHYAPEHLSLKEHFPAGEITVARLGVKTQFVEIELVTTYPGLLIGAGYSHSTGESEGEYKLGFFFDHTTGLPVLPGSSVKGLLRSFFPGRHKKGNQPLVEDYLQNFIHLVAGVTLPENITVEQLEKSLFEGLKIYGDNPDVRIGNNAQNLFFDAFPLEVIETKNRQRFLADDSITPHKHPLHDPLPLRLLKILPGVVFCFQFRLNDDLISIDDKVKIITALLRNHGAGAKSSAGHFGQLISREEYSLLSNARAQDKGGSSIASLSTNTDYFRFPKTLADSKGESRRERKARMNVPISQVRQGMVIKGTLEKKENGKAFFRLSISDFDNLCEFSRNVERLKAGEIYEVTITSVEGKPPKKLRIDVLNFLPIH